VHPEETVLFTADGASQDVRDAAPMDEYDQWADARDRAEDQSASAQYVSRDMTGYEDLDRNGTWSDDPSYGHVWAPTNVASDWAPYRYGRWVWVEPYGWTWIDDAPWGFAPFHYGRWAYSRDRWVWAPGVVRSRPVYAPALVVFVGGNNDYRDDRGYDRRNVTWFPLAPNEVYRPAYRASDQYVRRVNVTNVNVTNINVTNINVTNIQYRNQRVNGAVTTVGQDDFAGSRRIGRTATIVPVDQARNAHVVGDGAPVAPTQQSIIIPRQNGQPVSRPPEAAQIRQVVWKNTPPPRPATFASHADQLKTDGNKPVAPLPISQTRGAPRAGVTLPASRPAGTTAAAPSTDGRRVPGTQPNVNVQRYPTAPTQPDNNGGAKPAQNGNATTDVRRAPSTQPNTDTRPAPQPNVNVRPAPVAQPNTNTRPAPVAQPNTNTRPAPVAQPNANTRPAASPRTNESDRPMSHTDGPAPVNGSPNASPAHTVDPNTNVRPAPNTNVRPAPSAQPAQAPRTTQPAQAPRTAPSAPPNARPVPQSNVQPSERPVRQPPPPRAESTPPRTQTNDRPANSGRRVQGDDKEKTKPDQTDKTPRHR
jgi:hypothetical protein